MVYCNGLENRRAERLREFESLPVRFFHEVTMPFKITNVDKKDVTDNCVFEKTLKNGKKIYFEEEVWYRWGEVLVELDPRENGWVEGQPLVTDNFNRIDHNLNDGCYSSRSDVDMLSKKEQKLLNEAAFPEDAGWECTDCEVIFYGDVEIEETDEEYLTGF